MKYMILFRKMIIDGQIYYQGFTKAIGEKQGDNKIKITEGKYQGRIAYAMETMNDLLYLEINKIQYDVISDNQMYIKVKDKTFEDVSDFSEVADVALEFYNKYHDFKLLPDYDPQKIVSKVKEDLKDKVFGQEQPINKILTKICNNQMYYNSDLNKDYLRKTKSNILVVGPIGVGKSSIKESLKDNLGPIPVCEYTLTGDFGRDVFEIARSLVIEANGNRFLAERGVVIIDGIDDTTASKYDDEKEQVIYFMDTLKEIMQTKKVYFPRDDDTTASFDLSLLTFVCMADIDYDFTEDDNEKDSNKYLYYSKIDNSKVYALGLSGEMINSCFDDEVIFMEEMTKELALQILKNAKTSPVFKYKKMLAKNNRTLKIKEGFLEELASYGLEQREGFTGIIKLFKYLVESKGYENKTIILDPAELYDLQIGSFIEEIDEEKQDDDNEEKTFKNDDLQVDLQKRTINGLTVKDTVEIIKKSVKGQDKAAFSITNSFYNHIFNRYRGYTKKELRELKENVLLFGSTGVGKTAIVTCLANIFNIPFVREVATRYSKAGFKGEDVDSMLYDLVDAAKGDVKKAENGILYIDEIDKIRAREDVGNADSMAQGVQYNLLTLIEGDVRKIEATMNRGELEFDTSNLWVVGTGAFDGLYKCIMERCKKENGLGKVGFGESTKVLKDIPKPTDDDLYAYGIDRQFAGRFPNKVVLDDISIDTMCDIINNPDGGYITLIKKGYSGDGIVLSMSDGFKKALAKKALMKKQGARGIHSAFMNFKETIDENIQAGDVDEVILDENCIDNLENIQYVKRKK